jgi:Vam6/Vps39-like protein vacuolar protein sorting-associated protein 39
VGRVALGDETGAAAALRRRLFEFLTTSVRYSAAKILDALSQGDVLEERLLEERAILHSRNGQHEQALSIFIHRLADLAAAEAYCARVHKAGGDDGAAVYLSLLSRDLIGRC